MNKLYIYHKEPQYIDIDSVEYLQGSINYSWLFQIGQPSPILLSRCLRHMHELLPGFLRIEKSFLVNPAHIVGHRLRINTPSVIYLSEERALPVSRRQTKPLIAYFEQRLNTNPPTWLQSTR